MAGKVLRAAVLTEQWPDAHIETVGGREEVVIYTGWTWTEDGHLRKLAQEEIVSDRKTRPTTQERVGVVRETGGA